MSNEQLRALLEKASPGPWIYDDRGDMELHSAKPLGDSGRRTICVHGYDDDFVDFSKEEFALIAAMRNELERLLNDSDALAAACAEVALEKERADSSWTSLDRIIDRYSKCANDLKASGAEIARLRKAIKQVFDKNGCGCIKDMPGDNSTCRAHEILFDVAREPKS